MVLEDSNLSSELHEWYLFHDWASQQDTVGLGLDVRKQKLSCEGKQEII